MSDKFNRAVELLLKHEGGYVNHPNDPGGETNFGISKRTYPHLDIKNLTKEQAIALYKLDWWDKYGFEYLEDEQLVAKYFDLAVNMGFSAANKLYLAAMNESDPYIALLHQAALRYARICKKDPAKLVFLEGWLNRLFDV